jgi:hypothetical protein
VNLSSERRLRQLHPALAAAVRDVIATLAVQGIVVEVVQGLRTFAEQDALFAQGRTKPGPVVTQARGGESNHNYGLAADLCPFANGKPDWSAPISVWATIGMAANARGLEWGGDWKKFLDKPHVQLPVTVKECRTCYEQGGMEAVWSAASQKLNRIERALTRPTRRRRRRRPAKRRARNAPHPTRRRGS